MIGYVVYGEASCIIRIKSLLAGRVIGEINLTPQKLEIFFEI